MITLFNVVGLLIAYLLGSIPSAVWIGKYFYGIDVREYGSGNAGATNTFRVLGKKAGIPVLLIDIFKGWISVNMAYLTDYNPGSEQFVNFQLVLGIAALLGHIFPVYAGFRGGKGIATLLGIILAVHPLAALISMAVFVVVLLVSRYVSLGSMIAAISFPVIIIVVFKTAIPSLVIFSLIIAVLVLITHQKNIERLIRKEESKTRLIRKKNISGKETH
jgi:acyl phosphate:glycerol-3-phosphate acyltransferase